MPEKIESRYIALVPLRYGEGWIDAGKPYPAGDASRDYAGMMARGEIADMQAPGRAQPHVDPAEVAALRKQIAELSEQLAAVSEQLAAVSERPAAVRKAKG